VALQQLQGMFVVAVETKPGSPAPTNNYSITITDDRGADILGGLAASAVSSTNAQLWAVSSSTTPLNGSLTLNLTGNSVNSAQGTVQIYIGKSLIARNGSGGGGGVTQVNSGTGLTGGPITTTGSLLLASIANDDYLRGSAAPTPTALSAFIDSALVLLCYK
jgi:hypothetical protein